MAYIPNNLIGQRTKKNGKRTRKKYPRYKQAGTGICDALHENDDSVERSNPAGKEGKLK
jgi:hypothetical protein